MSADVMIYGANGYTGELTARRMVALGMRPLLAGRNQAAIRALGQELNLETRVFELGDQALLEEALEQVDVALHCAGPFRDTFAPLVKSCLLTGTHYLDISGELEIYRRLIGIDERARAAGVMLLPGIGFDVAPSDCLALHLKNLLPEARRLRLAFRFYGPAQPSRGTLKSGLNMISHPIQVRRGGKLVSVAQFSQTRQVDFGRGEEEVRLMTWGDVVTAYHSTRIPDIEDYFRLSRGQQRLLRWAHWLGPLATLGPAQALIKAQIERRSPGPTEEQIAQSSTVVWGEVEDAFGRRAVTRLHGPEAYEFTALAAIAAVRRVLDGQASPGYQTPATAFGEDFVLDVPGTRFEDITSFELRHSPA